jgi:23S rRNA (cytidine1920-2'-O)/16S rRNA (cytidine1409-2'-O)-methyltransferase
MSPGRRERIDKLLVERGLAETRSRAQAMVMAGEVLVGDHRVDKPGQLVDVDLPIRLKGEVGRYVSRGAGKLEAALAAFGIDPTGLRCVDLGASTGGFTDLLLQRGAREVWAVDVGYGQLHDKLRRDPRVHVFERVNARYVTLDALEAEPFDLAVLDLSFISLALVLPAARDLLRPGGQMVMLVKPQFEVGPQDVGKGGVVRDPAARRRAIDRIAQVCRELGMEVAGCIDSPVHGPAGNVEALLWARRPV